MRKIDIYIAITTYNRPQDFQKLLEDINRETKDKNVHIHIYDDSSFVEDSDGSYADFLCTGHYDLTRYAKNHGKKGYWQIMNDVFRDAETWDFKFFFFLQDDCRLTKGFFDLAIQEYSDINDPNKATLCTFTPQSVYDRVMWGNRKAEDVNVSGKKFLKCHYVDCIFMCPRETLQLLKFSVDPVPNTRFTSNVISSGVGQQLTTRLIRLRKTMYCAWSSLISSHSNESKMNEEERKKNPLHPLIRERSEPLVLTKLLSFTRERVTVGIASIKTREKSLFETVMSLIDQVDEMHVYLNDYDKVPQFLQNNPKITFYLGKIYKDRGDTAKYYALNKVTEGYYFSCDDDLIYPPDYVERTVNFLKDHENKVIATYHGAILKKGKLASYYKDRKQVHYSAFQRISIEVDIGGTGVMAFHVNHFKPDTTKFKYPNMSDIWVGIQAQEAGMPILCAPRYLNWIKSQEIPTSETIYGSKSNHDLQTEVINNWKVENGEFINYYLI